MKKLLALCLIVVATTTTQQTHAATYTNYLDDASNAIAQVHAVTEGQVQSRLGKALKAFNKNSTSVAGDYSIFVSVSSQLLPLLGAEGTEVISATLSNAFSSFVMEGLTQLGGLNARLEALSQFHGLRKAASNQLVQAQSAILTPTQTTNIQEGILAVRLAFVKIGVANKLLTKAEAKPGYAPEAVLGETLTAEIQGESVTLSFIDGTTFEGNGGGAYIYSRTGLNTGTLILEENAGSTTTVLLKFSSATAGKFNAESEDSEGTSKASGTFTLAD